MHLPIDEGQNNQSPRSRGPSVSANSCPQRYLSSHKYDARVHIATGLRQFCPYGGEGGATCVEQGLRGEESGPKKSQTDLLLQPETIWRFVREDLASAILDLTRARRCVVRSRGPWLNIPHVNALSDRAIL